MKTAIIPINKIIILIISLILTKIKSHFVRSLSKGPSPLFSKIVLFEKTNQNELTHNVGLRHPRIYVKNRRKHVVQNIEKGLSPNFFIILIKMD